MALDKLLSEFGELELVDAIRSAPTRTGDEIMALASEVRLFPAVRYCLIKTPGVLPLGIDMDCAVSGYSVTVHALLEVADIKETAADIGVMRGSAGQMRQMLGDVTADDVMFAARRVSHDPLWRMDNERIAAFFGTYPCVNELAIAAAKDSFAAYDLTETLSLISGILATSQLVIESVRG